MGNIVELACSVLCVAAASLSYWWLKKGSFASMVWGVAEVVNPA